MNWLDVKDDGSTHYKTGGTEPIDLYKDGKMLQDFALANIIKYAFRNRSTVVAEKNINVKDLDKIIHYAVMLKELATVLINKQRCVNVDEDL